MAQHPVLPYAQHLTDELSKCDELMRSATSEMPICWDDAGSRAHDVTASYGLHSDGIVNVVDLLQVICCTTR